MGQARRHRDVHGVTRAPGGSSSDWTGIGSGSYSGNATTASVTVNSAIEETASFEPMPGARFNLTFVENGMVPGTWWGVSLNGQGYSTSQPQLTVGGLYAWPTGSARALRPGRAVCLPERDEHDAVRGFRVSTDHRNERNRHGPGAISFTPESLVSVYASAGGEAQLVVGGVPSGGSWWATSVQQAALQETVNGRYLFTAWVGTGLGSYSGTAATPTITVGNGPITEFAQFTAILPPPAKQFNLTVTLSTALATGTTWGVTVKSPTLGTLLYSTTGSTIVLSGLLSGSYGLVLQPTLSPDRLHPATPRSPPTWRRCR